MSDKLPALTNLAVPALTDLLYIVTPGIDPLGSFNISFAQLRAAILSGVPQTIEVNTTVVNSAGAGPDVLHTFTLPANSLANDNDCIEIWYAGGFAAVNRDKAVQAQFAGVTYENSGVFDFDGSTGWMLGARIVRIDATHVESSHILLENLVQVTSGNVASSQSVGGSWLCRTATSFVVPDLNANASVMRVRSVVTGGAAADVFQSLSILKLVQF